MEVHTEDESKSQNGNSGVIGEPVLSSPTVYLHFWIFLISIPNLIVIGVMVLIFALAILIPFPTKPASRGAGK